MNTSATNWKKINNKSNFFYFKPLMMAHYFIQCGTLLPILWCVTYYLCWLGSTSFYRTPLSPIYRNKIFSFQSSQYLILFCVLDTLCEVPPSKRIAIHLCYSLLRHGLLSSCLFMPFYGISRTWLHNIWYQSSFLRTGYCKTIHLGIFTTTIFMQFLGLVCITFGIKALSL